MNDVAYPPPPPPPRTVYLGLIGGLASAIGAATIDPGTGWTPASIAFDFPGRGGRSAETQGGE